MGRSGNHRGLEPTMICVKNLIIGMNCLFVMTGILLIATGSTIKDTFSTYDKLFGSGLIPPSLFLTVVGAIVIIVALFGSIGALRESTCLINLYTLALVVVFILEISAGITGVALQATIRSTLSFNFKWAIQHNYIDNYNGLLTVIDSIQQNLECCGGDSPQDWAGVIGVSPTSLLQEGDVIVPDSCCGNWTLDTNDCTKPYTDGCLPTLVAIAKSGAVLLTGAAITVALIQAMGIYFSHELAKAIRRAKSLRTLRQMEIRSNLVSSYQEMNKAQVPDPAPVVYLSGGSADTNA